MRITNNMLINNMVKYIGNNLTRMDRYQSQLATGKKIRVPSDDPVVAARALKLRTDVAEITQYQRNIKDAQSWLEMTETALNDMGDIFQRLIELATGSTDTTKSEEDLGATEKEVEQLRTQLVNLSNSAYAGRYLFSGYKTDKVFMNADGTFAIAVENSEMINYEIGMSDSININVAGGDLFNDGNATTVGGKGKFIDDIDIFINALNTKDSAVLNTMNDAFLNDLDNILRVRADVGARVNRLELTSNRMLNDKTNFTKLMSENENVDMAETLINLKNEENVYNASLAGGARVIMPSLLDFLK